MADPSAYNEISKINPQLAGAIYQYNTISSSMPAEKVDPMLLQQNAFQEQIGRTVYVGNLNPKIVEDQLIKVFGTCGIINLAKVAQEGMGLKPDAGTRFGFIEFQTRAGAEAATKLDGILLGGRPIRVGLSNGPIIQPTAYGPGAATMRNRPPLYKVSAGGFVILDQNAEDTINKRIDNKLSSVLSRLNKKYGGGSGQSSAPAMPAVPAVPAMPAAPAAPAAPANTDAERRDDRRRDERDDRRREERRRDDRDDRRSHRHDDRDDRRRDDRDDRRRDDRDDRRSHRYDDRDDRRSHRHDDRDDRDDRRSHRRHRSRSRSYSRHSRH
ncbi:hypothetical protein WA556_004920 [Blastocystis sp. ATCC 50177/Nand II]